MYALLAVALVAAVLAGCGGSGSDSSSSETARTTAAGEEGHNGSQAQSQGGAQNHGNGSSNHRQQAQQKKSGGSGSKPAVTPLQVSGGGSGQFRVKGGDNSIQEFGNEADESELQEVAEIVHGFYAARAEGKWDTACSLLSKKNIEQLEQITGQGRGCSAALKAFTQPLPASVQREVTTVDAGSFRHEGAQGFLIYYGAGHTTYSMPLVEEGGGWKVGALIGTVLS